MDALEKLGFQRWSDGVNTEIRWEKNDYCFILNSLGEWSVMFPIDRFGSDNDTVIGLDRKVFEAIKEIDQEGINNEHGHFRKPRENH